MMFFVCVCLLMCDVFAATRYVEPEDYAPESASERQSEFGMIFQRTQHERAVFFKQALLDISRKVKQSLAELEEGEDLVVVDWRVEKECEPLEQSLKSLKKYVTDRLSSLKLLGDVLSNSGNVEEKKRTVWLLDGLTFAPSFFAGPELDRLLRFRGGGLLCLQAPALTGEFLFEERAGVEADKLLTLVMKAEHALKKGDGLTPSEHKEFSLDMGDLLQERRSCVDIVKFFQDLALLSCGNAFAANNLIFLIRAFLADVAESKFDLPTVHTLALDMLPDANEREKNIYMGLTSTIFSAPEGREEKKILFPPAVVQKALDAIQWMAHHRENVDVGMLCAQVDCVADLFKRISLSLGEGDFTAPESAASLKVCLHNMCVWCVPGLQELERLSDALENLSKSLKKRAVLSRATKKLLSSGTLSYDDLCFVIEVASVEEFRREGLRKYKANFARAYDRNEDMFEKASRYLQSKECFACRSSNDDNLPEGCQGQVS